MAAVTQASVSISAVRQQCTIMVNQPAKSLLEKHGICNIQIDSISVMHCVQFRYQPPGRGPVPGPGINYTGPSEVLLEFVILVS
jgi:hypothetical protein